MITKDFPFKYPQDSDDESTNRHIELLKQQFDEWDDRLKKERTGQAGFAQAYYWVERTDDGDIRHVPQDVLINAADEWGWNFGGKVRYALGNKKAHVTVYID